MKIVIFGLTISSSWGNGHATVWRGLLRELTRRGHYIVFFERDVPYYATHRDLAFLPGGLLRIYNSWAEVASLAQRELCDATIAIVTSYCPDAIAAAELIWSSNAIGTFYDLDTPVTIAQLRRGEAVPYLHPQGLANFDLVLSFTGGAALDYLRDQLGARAAVPLYGSVDPKLHRPVPADPQYRAVLSYLGTYSEDRQTALQELFVKAAARLPEGRFMIGGAQYPAEFPWAPNIFFLRHLPPADHASFFCSSRLTLNVTRAAMAAMGWCPSGRLFEAAACGVPLVSDWWEGLDDFLEPNLEILIASTADQVIAALQISDAELNRIRTAARERILSRHSAEARAREFERIFENVHSKEMAAA